MAACVHGTPGSLPRNRGYGRHPRSMISQTLKIGFLPGGPSGVGGFLPPVLAFPSLTPLNRATLAYFPPDAENVQLFIYARGNMRVCFSRYSNQLSLGNSTILPTSQLVPHHCLISDHLKTIRRLDGAI